MLDTFKKDNRSFLRKTIQSVSEKFGYKYGDSNYEFELPKVKESV